MTDYASIISQVGFPIAAAVVLYIQNNKNTENYVNLSRQASLDSQASTEAIKKSSEVIEKNTAAFIELKAAIKELGNSKDAK